MSTQRQFTVWMSALGLAAMPFVLTYLIRPQLILILLFGELQQNSVHFSDICDMPV